MKFQASIHGAKLKGAPVVEAKEKVTPDNFQFGDPDKDYNHLNQEQKEELTRKMKASHKKWASGSELES